MLCPRPMDTTHESPAEGSLSLAQVFIAGYGAPRSNTAVLEQLLATRHEIAAMLGAPSYAHYQARICAGHFQHANSSCRHAVLVPPCTSALKNKSLNSCRLQVEDEATVAGHPAAVRSFLLSLLDAVRTPAGAELESLQRLTRQTGSATDGLQAWDQQFYRQLAMVSSIRQDASISRPVVPAMAPSVRSVIEARLIRQRAR